MQLTPNEQLLLGIIAEQPRHGYEIEMIISERGMRDWTDVGFSSIYYLLDKLTKRHLLTETKGKGLRKMYHITEEGQKLCKEGAEYLIANTTTKAPILIGMANSPLLPEGELEKRLHERMSINEIQLDAIKKKMEQQKGSPAFVMALFDYSISQLVAENDWIARTIKNIKEEIMEKIDFKKELKQFYAPKNKDWEIVDVPAMQYLMIDGEGDPNGAESYKHAVEALFSLSYTIKFTSKRMLGKDYAVMPLEGLWYADDMDVFVTRDKSRFKWTMMIMQPEWITQEMVDEAKIAVEKKKGITNLAEVSLKTLNEGKSAQLLHIGSYDDESPKLAYLHNEYMPQNGLKFNGNHHEIYIGDPRKTSPEKLKTVLRQPVM